MHQILRAQHFWNFFTNNFELRNQGVRSFLSYSYIYISLDFLTYTSPGYFFSQIKFLSLTPQNTTHFFFTRSYKKRNTILDTNTLAYTTISYWKWISHTGWRSFTSEDLNEILKFFKLKKKKCWKSSQNELAYQSIQIELINLQKGISIWAGYSKFKA